MLLTTTTASAQQSKILDQINEIKMQNDIYYWDQYSHPSLDTAMVGVNNRMMISINVERDEDDELPLEAVVSKFKYIKVDRGSVVRVFAYCKKSDIQNTGTSESSINNPVNTASTSIAKPEQAKAFVPDAFVQRVMRLSDFFKVYDFLREQKLDGQVLQFGPLKDVDDYSSLELILFDMESKAAVGLLSPERAGGVRTNMLTGADDSLDNYPEDMTLVIWYIK